MHPWSRRGKRTALQHPDAEIAVIGLKSIAYMKPAVWIIEVGEMPSPSGTADLMDKMNEILNARGAAYTIQPLRNITPALCGFPVRRTRTFIIGWRLDVAAPELAVGPLTDLVGNPMSVDSSFATFLGLRPAMDWSRVGQFPSRVEMDWQSHDGCRCGLDPWISCPKHPCKCGNCGKDGVGCGWRGRLAKFIDDEGIAPVLTRSAGTMTYLNVLEMHGGLGPDNPRKRIYLNLVAMSPKSQPLADTLMVVDLAHIGPFGVLHNDGAAPVCTTNSDMWVVQTGVAPSVQHYSALMGLDLSMVALSRKMTDSWMRQRLGMAVHIGNFGVVLLAAVTPPLQRLLS